MRDYGTRFCSNWFSRFRAQVWSRRRSDARNCGWRNTRSAT